MTGHDAPAATDAYDVLAVDGEAPPGPGDEVWLRASRCRACDRWEFPRRQNCPACNGPAEDVALGGPATLGAFTAVLHPPPGSLVPVPYLVGVGQFGCGLSVLGLVVGCGLDDLRAGMSVELEAFNTEAGTTYAYRPSTSSSAPGS